MGFAHWTVAIAVASGLMLADPALAQDANEGSDAAADAAADVEIDVAEPPDDAGASPPVVGYAPPLPPPPAVVAPPPPPPPPTAGFIAPIDVRSRAALVRILRLETWEHMLIKHNGNRQALLANIHRYEIDQYQPVDGQYPFKPKSRSTYVFIPVCMTGATPRPPRSNEVFMLPGNAPARQIEVQCRT